MNGLRVTLGELVCAVQDTARCDAEVVAVVNHLFASGRAALVRRMEELPSEPRRREGAVRGPE